MLRDAAFIALKDVQYLLKERATLMWLLLMPVVFFYFIGTITSGFSGGTTNSRTTLAMETSGNPGFLFDQLQKRLGENGFDVVLPQSEADLAAYSRRLTIPANFTDMILSGEQAQVQLTSRNSGLTGQYDEFRIQKAVYTLLADVVASIEVAGGQPTPAALQNLNDMTRTLTLKVTQGGQRRQIPSGFDQAIPGIMVMFTMLVLLTSGSILLLIERNKGLLRRLASTPIARGHIVMGKWGGKMITGMLQIVTAMVLGTLLFKMNWGPDIAMVLLVLFAWGAFCASLGVLLANIGDSEGQVSAMGVMTTMILAALGGCWWPIEVTPGWMQTLQLFLPSGWAMDAMHKLINFGAGAASALPHVFALLFAAVVLGVVGAKKFKFQ